MLCSTSQTNSSALKARYFILECVGRSGILAKTFLKDAAGMRTAWLIGLGLVIGILGSVSVINAWRQRTPLPVAVMTVMQYHLGQLQDTLKQGRCNAANSAHSLQRLNQAATDLEPAFAGADRDFFTHASHLRDTLNRAITSAATDCATLAQTLQSIGQACDACHQQYR
jgi:hypothetical protein